MSEERYVFNCEWYDEQAALIRNYMLTFYPKDTTVEMYDVKNKRLFLKRSEYPAISLEHIYKGATLCIYGRQLKIMGYADVFTKRIFEDRKSKTLALIKPDCYNHIGKIIALIQKNELTISNLQMLKMSREMAEEQYVEHKGKPFYETLVDFMTSDVCIAMELIGQDAVTRWRTLCGPTNTQKAQEEAPDSIRARFGTDGTRNAVHGSDSSESASRELDIFFGENPKKSKIPTTAIFNNCTLAIIKPHIIMKNLGEVIDCVLAEGFEISAMKMWNLPKNIVEEFMEVYRGILPEYHDAVEEMSAGPVVAMEVRQKDAVNSFRKLVGPMDPEIAHHLRPDTIRAKFGENIVQNGIHCTDLEEDGLLEVEYFFNILYNRNHL